MKKIKIDLLSRVEGHGGILVHIDQDRVKEVEVRIFEGPRLFEQLLVGKTAGECLNIVPRICAICTVSHRFAGIRAHEKALGIQVKDKVKLTRLLMHFGEIIESNSLHVFVLSLPDFFGVPSLLHLLKDHQETVISGLKIKEFGNLVMRKTTARMMHGENAVIGGFGTYPTNRELDELSARAQELIPVAKSSIATLAKLPVPTFCQGKEDATFMCLDSGEEFGFVGETVLISPREQRPVEEYKNLTNERVVSHSFAKRCRYGNKTFTVGALARINLLGERLSGDSLACFRQLYSAKWKRNPLYNNHAQLIEILYALEKIPVLVDRLKRLKNPPRVVPALSSGEATGAVEAPRGLLYHHYAVKDNLITRADIITPTDQNLDEMERSVLIAAKYLIKSSPARIRDSLEMVVRAYDPCISCSTHLVRIERS
jgi:sulfhydrogenase subunit alpha